MTRCSLQTGPQPKAAQTCRTGQDTQRAGRYRVRRNRRSPADATGGQAFQTRHQYECRAAVEGYRVYRRASSYSRIASSDLDSDSRKAGLAVGCINRREVALAGADDIGELSRGEIQRRAVQRHPQTRSFGSGSIVESRLLVSAGVVSKCRKVVSRMLPGPW